MELFRTITDPRLPDSTGINNKEFKEYRRASYRRNKIRNAILLYGTFMADVINAETSDDVRMALEAAAAPPGSSRIKRELEFNLSVNSYLGIGAGAEKLLDLPGDNIKPTLGLSVPIGLAFSFKLPRSQRGSFSVFLPILDIGAVTAFRFDRDGTSDLPELEFKNFIAPGGFLNYNFYKAPLTAGIGWQYGPQSRVIDDLGTTSRSWRLMFNLTIDVPIFNLINGDRSTVRRKKKKGRAKRNGYYGQPVIQQAYY